jgi:hypothetical protein
MNCHFMVLLQFLLRVCSVAFVTRQNDGYRINKYTSGGVVLFSACDYNRTTSSAQCLTTGNMILERYQLHEVHILNL